MSEIVIKVENLSKEYRLGTINHGMLHRDVQSWWARARGKEDPNSLVVVRQPSEDRRSLPLNPRFMALDDVSFDVIRGETLGIIGRNGAGKSTLLKILSKVTAPTSGVVKIKGRVASLLEVGTGFHPELTGRENIYLNGAILGMSKKEISGKFDEIVTFAEVDKFIDTPVKRYSSGMYVRLAFAVAAHLEPEVLIVDEVLAVGDIRFQKKCINKMGHLGNGGRTILVVSHNMDIIRLLCNRAVWLDNGKVSHIGECSDTIRKYIGRNNEENKAIIDTTNWTDRDGSGEIQSACITLFHPERGPTTIFEFGESIGISIDLQSRSDHYAAFSIIIKTEDGRPVCDLVSANGGLDWCKIPTGAKVQALMPENRFYPGTYVGSLWIGDEGNRRLDFVKDCIRFDIDQGLKSGIERPLRPELGVVYQPSRWEIVLPNKKIP